MVKNWSISCVLRVPADGGDLYFKTVPPLFVQEARITATVAGLFPTNVPGVVGIEETRGWTLLEDFGTRRLRTEPLAQWEKAVRILARMHLAYLDRASALLAAGFPDRRPRRLAEQIAPLLADPITSAALAGRTLARLRKQVGRLRDFAPSLRDQTRRRRSFTATSIPATSRSTTGSPSSSTGLTAAWPTRSSTWSR
jgi:hypothetical protein